VHCEGALVTSWEKLGQERLVHQQELDGAIQLLHQAVEEAKRSGYIADRFGHKVAELQAALGANDVAQTKEAADRGPPEMCDDGNLLSKVAIDQVPGVALDECAVEMAGIGRGGGHETSKGGTAVKRTNL
jgi:hypothetical protein